MNLDKGPSLYYIRTNIGVGRGTSILGEVRNVEKKGYSAASHNFLAVFALAHSKINKIA